MGSEWTYLKPSFGAKWKDQSRGEKTVSKCAPPYPQRRQTRRRSLGSCSAYSATRTTNSKQGHGRAAGFAARTLIGIELCANDTNRRDSGGQLSYTPSVPIDR